MRRTVARLVAAGLVACSMLGSASVAHTGAAAALKTYTDKAHHFSFQYPATWKLAHPALEATEKGIGITSQVVVVSPDLLVGFGVEIKPSASTTGKMKAAVGALMRENVTVIGSISYDTKPNANGLPSASAEATIKLDASHTADAAVAGVSTSRQTYYILGYVMTKPAATSGDQKEYNAVGNSFATN